ncbi:MAG: hypothetical protein UR39_C0003G0184 [Candidatus Woesebacteria bacterium GW2011_GWA1_33_30]|uniref:Uncharacterized protein n=1 Tax=Candidatus Woesebacteria bacterium GW2011_GWA2_33_28 TaxID=1618561 RepID=A0A0G0CWL3_9BACT|nr:MAG: hypothetical protein UR38_C0003G0187 [Candidatus Woesebacteria bacterium GW2011_GWA2_33_28]KKP48649.1 MAG: hypothetical protein UR39_C0003G0184 [Candidatus Woesebacteria bacterium GW2011_GWA1_33_30]KKP49788.1 MAG: hypothetical protein UR40_C0004G0187 [Microgenomates group bacterium GW2011_GWC1_33_32]KKP52405.1 MAG: hypothetical protein UR44_C0003G0187 [Candidatus Woesebacteria bacterium GW2011_GWB1_33_38]
MEKTSLNNQYPNWLNEALQIKVRTVFEPRYNRSLSDYEVITIAESYTSFMEHFFKFKLRLDYDMQI